MEDAMNKSVIAKRLDRRKLREKRSQSVGTKLTFEEEREIERAAEEAGKTASEWAREVLLREARRSKNDAVFTEVIAIRALLNNILRPLVTGQRITLENFDNILARIRVDKHKVAQETMQQYTRPDQKEQ